jgi:hypothetical protein
MSHRVDLPDSSGRGSRRRTRRRSRARTLATNGVVAVVVLVVALTWLAMRESDTPEDVLPEPTVTEEPVEPAESAPPVVGVLTADDAWVPGWRVVADEERAAVSQPNVCSATGAAEELSGPAQTLTNGSALVRVHVVTGLRDPLATANAIARRCGVARPGKAGTGSGIWTGPSVGGTRFRSSYTVWPGGARARLILLVTVVDEGPKGGGQLDLADVVSELWYAVDGSPRPARSAAAAAAS